jgi:hypothetical protein
MLLAPIPFEYAKLLDPHDRVRRTDRPLSSYGSRVRKGRKAKA